MEVQPLPKEKDQKLLHVENRHYHYHYKIIRIGKPYSRGIRKRKSHKKILVYKSTTSSSNKTDNSKSLDEFHNQIHTDVRNRSSVTEENLVANSAVNADKVNEDNFDSYGDLVAVKCIEYAQCEATSEISIKTEQESLKSTEEKDVNNSVRNKTDMNFALASKQTSNFIPRISKALTNIANLRIAEAMFNRTLVGSSKRSNNDRKKNMKDSKWGQIYKEEKLSIDPQNATPSNKITSPNDNDNNHITKASKVNTRDKSNRLRAGNGSNYTSKFYEKTKITPEWTNDKEYVNAGVQVKADLRKNCYSKSSQNTTKRKALIRFVTSADNYESQENVPSDKRISTQKESGDAEGGTNSQEERKNQSSKENQKNLEKGKDDKGSSKPDKLHTLILIDNAGKFLECFHFRETDYQKLLKNIPLSDRLKLKMS